MTRLLTLVCVGLVVAGCGVERTPTGKTARPAEVQTVNLVYVGASEDMSHLAFGADTFPSLFFFYDAYLDKSYDGPYEAITQSLTHYGDFWGEDKFVADSDGNTGDCQIMLFEHIGLTKLIDGPPDYCDVRFSKDGKFIYGVSYNRVYKWNVSSGTLVKSWKPTSHGDWDVAMEIQNVSSRPMVGYFEENTFKIVFDLFAEAPVKRDLLLPKEPGDYKFSLDGKLVGARSEDKTKITLYDVATRKAVRELTLGGDIIGQNWKFLTKNLVAAPFGESCYFWSIETGKHILTFMPKLAPADLRLNNAPWIAFTPDGLFDGSEKVEYAYAPAKKMKRDGNAIRNVLGLSETEAPTGGESDDG